MLMGWNKRKGIVLEYTRHLSFYTVLVIVMSKSKSKIVPMGKFWSVISGLKTKKVQPYETFLYILFVFIKKIIYINISGCTFDIYYPYTVATCQKKFWKWILKNQISMVFIFSLCVRLSQFPGKALSPNDYSKSSHVQFLP